MYDLVVIGGGSGGLKVAAAAAKVGAKVAVIEKDRLGGEAIFAAAPGKGLVQAAKLVSHLKGAERFGLRSGPLQIDFAAVMGRVRDVAAQCAGTESEEVLRGQGIDLFRGSASFEAYDTVRVDGTTALASKRFVIATGSRPSAPPIPGLAEAGYLDGHSVWSLTKLPDSLIVLGDEPTGLELAQCFARFGTEVTFLTSSSRILPGDDLEASELLTGLLTAEGLTIKPAVVVKKVEVRDGRKVCKFQEPTSGATGEVAASAILVATGRLANVEELNLSAVGVHGDPEHGIDVDESLQTHSTRVFALGDVLLRHPYAQFAEREASVVFQNAVLKLKRKIAYANLPWATFVDPEVAAVGLLEAQAGLQQLPHRVYRVAYSEIDRAKIDGRTDGFAKVVATPSGKVLGATVVGEEASLIIQEFVLAIEKGLSLGDIASATAIYPSYAEVARHLANRHRAARLGSGYIQTALKLFYGFIPRLTGGNGTTEAETRAPVEERDAAAAQGLGH